MAKSQKTSVGRRGFLKNTAAGAAALVTTTPLVEAQENNGAGCRARMQARRLRRRPNLPGKRGIFGRRWRCAKSRGLARI